MKFIYSYESEYVFARRAFLALFLVNFAVWFFGTKSIRPDLTITPIPPGKHLLKALSLGDDGFIYRHFAYKVQIAGDDYGTTVPLKDYNYSKLQKWFYLLDEFDGKSEYIPSIAGFYYSNTQNPLDNIYIVDYLIKFASKDPNKYWRWLSTAMYLSNSKLKDANRIAEIAKIMVNLDSDVVPLWARTIGIFMMSKNDICASVKLIESLNQQEIEDIANDRIFGSKSDEGNIFLKLIVERIEELKKNPIAVQKCLRNKYE